MRAANPKADPHLFPVAAIPDSGPALAAESLHAFPAAELAGVTPLRPGLQDPGAFARIPANDQPRPRPTWPPLALGGAVLLLGADTAARLLFPVFQSEPPVGALTALLGGPFFLLSLRRGAAAA